MEMKLLLTVVVAFIATTSIATVNSQQSPTSQTISEMILSAELSTVKMQLKNAQDSLALQIKLNDKKEGLLKKGLDDQFKTIKKHETAISTLKTNQSNSEDEIKRLNDFLANMTQLLLNTEKQLLGSQASLQVCETSLVQEQSAKSQVEKERDTCRGNLAQCRNSLNTCVTDFNSTKNTSDDYQRRLNDCLKEGVSKDGMIAALNKKVVDTSKILEKCERNALRYTKDIDSKKRQLASCGKKLLEYKKKVDDSKKAHDITKHTATAAYAHCKSKLDHTTQQLVKNGALKDCATWKLANVPSGEYLVDPDGPGTGVAPFKVYCSFTNSKVETRIGHHAANHFASKTGPMKCRKLDDYGIDNARPSRSKHGKSKSKWSSWHRQTRSTSSHSSGHSHDTSYCEGQKIDYGISKSQLTALKAGSKSCVQTVSWECFDQSAITIFSQDGEYKDKKKWRNYYYSYSPSGSRECACAATSSCLKDMGCNCFADEASWQHDDIVISKMDDLPVTEVALGDLSNRGEKGKFTVGDLVCV